ncbi:MAG TPA: DNA primase [Planctomycetota bacterium]|nr:DNA primase [Planctomycetota bacterium]
MAYRDDTKQEVLRAADIVSVVERYVQLTKNGRSYKALCPFHQEKTPSFHVSPERGTGTFKCFGCGKGGNAIDFVIEKEQVDFKTALRMLADWYNVRLPDRRDGADRAEANARLRAFEANKLAQEFFRASLLSSREGELARDYVAKRGIDEEWAERFGIGYAPRRGNHLLRFLSRRGFDVRAAIEAGVAGDKGNGPFEYFRGRLTFPIRDTLGRTIAFGGRALYEEQQPKYLNSPETAIFKKREVVYGLDLAKAAASERKQVAIVEGYTDVILGHQAGFPWFVAPLGTAFTIDHANALKRVAPRLLVFFDGDEAGAKANRRGLVEAAKHSLEKFTELKVARLPDGLDPADLVVQRGPAALAEAIEKAILVSDFFVEAAGASTTERVKAIEEMCEILAGLEADTYRELEIAATAHRFHVDEALVRQKVKQHQEAAKNKAAPASSQPATVTEAGGAYAGRAELDKRERWLLASLLAVPALVEDARARGISPDACRDPRAKAIVAALLAGEDPAGLDAPGAVKLVAEVRAGIDPQKPYEREWAGVAALLLEERGESLCTKAGTDELKESVARKLRRFELQKRDLSLKSGERAGE